MISHIIFLIKCKSQKDYLDIHINYRREIFRKCVDSFSFGGGVLKFKLNKLLKIGIRPPLPLHGKQN